MLHGDVTDERDVKIDRTALSSGMAPSNAALIVLRDLGAADGKLVIMAAFRELLASRAWRLEKVWRLRGTVVALTPGDAPTPLRMFLPRLSAVIGNSPSFERRGATMHELEAVVRHLATTIYTPRALINQLLDELTGAGLVTDREPSVRGRTAAGEALLAEEINRLGSADADDDDAWNELFDAVFDHAYEAASLDFDSGNGDNLSTALRYGAYGGGI